MAGAIPSEPGAADLLAQAKSDAYAQLHKELPGVAVGSGTAPAPAGTPAAPQDLPHSVGPSDESLGSQEGGLDLHGYGNTPAATPAPADTTPKETHGTGDFWDAQNAKDFVRDTFKGTGSEAANVVPRVAAKLGGLVAGGAEGLGVILQGGYNKVTGKDSTALTDALFNFDKNYIAPAVDAWTPPRSDVTGEGEGSGGAAQAIGSGLEAVPYMLAGLPGIAAMLGNAFRESAKEQINTGHDLTSAVTNGAIDAVGTAAMLLVGSRDPSLVKRIIKTIPAGDFVAISQNILKKATLMAEGKPDEAAKISWNDGLGEATIQNGVFGFFRKPPKGSKAEGPSPATLKAAGPDTPAGPSTESVKVAEAAAPVSPVEDKVPVSPVGDKPSAEPVKDLRAQFTDMKDESTPRKGVFLSKDNLNNLAGTRNSDAASVRSQLAKAQKEGRVVTTDSGVLVVTDKADVKAARARLTAGEDPQAVIGDYTGAGKGKTPDMTAVVQGTDATGAVVQESAVTPAEVPAKVEEVKAAGREPIVTTPEAAQARRAEEIAKEQQAPPVEETPAATIAKPPVAAEAMPKAGEPAAPIEVRAEPVDPDAAAAKKIGVSIEAFRKKREMEAAKAAEKPVEISAPEAEVVNNAAAEESTTGPEIQNEKIPADVPAAKPTAVAQKTALESLPEALSTHETQETPEEGRKNVPLAERQDNASAFAMVLHEAAKEAAGKAPDAVVERATAAAKAAERLTLKSKNATDKGQGTGHVKVTALVSEMHKAARELLGKSQVGDEAVVPAKVAELKAKVAKRAAKKPVPKTGTAVPKTGTIEAKIEHPVNEKYKGEIAPKKQSESMQNAALRMKNRYVSADKADLPKIRDEIEQWLHENLGDTYSKDQLDSVMEFMRKERQEANPDADLPKKMSETVQEADHEFDQSEAFQNGMSRTYRPDLADTKGERLRNIAHDQRMRGEWTALGDNVADEGFLHLLFKRQNTGDPTGAHFIMDHLIKSTDSPILRDLLSKIRQHLPDLPVYVRDQIVHPETGAVWEHAGGLFHPDSNTIQIKLDRFANPRKIAQTLVHEFIHGATVHELDSNPTGQLARAFEAAHKVLLQRLKSQYGEKMIADHVAYFNDAKNVAKPDGYLRHLYGIANVHEMASELLVNPEFQRVVADSEIFASPSEILPTTRTTLFKRLFTAIGQFFGVKDPRLLSHIASLTQSIMEAQSQRFSNLMAGRNDQFHDMLSAEMKRNYGASPEEIAVAERGLASLRDEPPPVRGVDDELRDIAGEEVRNTARSFIHSAKSRVVESLRKAVPALKTEAQLYRDHMGDFGGKHDPSNPIREMQEIDIKKNATIKRITDVARDVATAWHALKSTEGTAVGALLRDATMNKIDPRVDPASQPLVAQVAHGFGERHAQMQARLAKLSPEGRKVFGDVIDTNARMLKEQRRAGVDTALAAFGADLTPAQTKLLYDAHGPHELDALVGHGMPIDIGEGNDRLRSTLADFSSVSEIDGPYAHLGRHGEHVVSAESEGSREFDTEARAKKFAATVDELNPSSRSSIAERGGKWVVDYKNVKYVSMHETMAQAEADKARMEAAGFNIGTVTQKTLSKESTPLSGGMQELVAEAERKINRNGIDAGTEALVESLRSAFLQITANRSAYAGSRLARKNVAGVKATEMARNFAEHVLSTAWHTAQMRTVFDRASALARVRGMARDARGGDSQRTMTRRGVFVREMGLRAQQDLATYGKRNITNSVLAKLGFANFLVSPSHAIVWMTQNFTTGIPLGGARWGYGKTAASFTASMKLLASPAFRGTVHAHFASGSDKPIHAAILAAVKDSPRFGKWSTGENSALQQLIDRGVLNHSYSEELRKMAQGGNDTVNKLFDYARLLPTMADQFNRVSTALVALEMTGGDIRKAADFVDEVHANYGSQNKSRFFKAIGKFPGGASVVMFKTYVQAMAHLLYGNIKHTIDGAGAGRKESAKTVAGLIIGTALFAGIYKAVALEPLRLALYAYHKLFDEEGDSWDFEAATHHFLVDHFGRKAGNLLANGPVTNALGFDMSSRMGLSDLFFHNPPDLLTSDDATRMEFVGQQFGPMTDLVSTNISDFSAHWRRGEPFQAVTSILPVKQVHDAIKAYQMATTGKLSGTGAQRTAPSGYDAAMQLLGLRPTTVALAANRQSELIEAGQAENLARKNIVKDLTLAVNTKKGLGTVMARVASFNRRFPQRPIMPNDVTGQMRFSGKSQQQESALGY